MGLWGIGAVPVYSARHSEPPFRRPASLRAGRLRSGRLAKLAGRRNDFGPPSNSPQVRAPRRPIHAGGIVSPARPRGTGMYVTHFGLRHRPFRPTPDPAAYYPATTH